MITIPYNVYYQPAQVCTRKNNTNCTPCDKRVFTCISHKCVQTVTTLYSITELVVSFLLYPLALKCLNTSRVNSQEELKDHCI